MTIKKKATPNEAASNRGFDYTDLSASIEGQGGAG